MLSIIIGYREHLLDDIENRMINLVDYKQISNDEKKAKKSII